MKTTLLSSIQRNFYFLLYFLVATLCLVSCKKDETISAKEVKGEAKVKMINASQNATAIDFYLDNTKVNTTALAFGEGSDYIKIASGTKASKVQNNGMDEAESEVVFVPTISYTSFYVENRASKGTILTYEDDLGPTEAGKARIRFVNTSPYFTNTVNVNLTGAILLVNALPFAQASAYFSVDPGANLRVSIVGTAIVKVVPAADIEAGKIYTFWFSGTSNATLTVNKITYN
jgi:hypothetical protein